MILHISTYSILNVERMRKDLEAVLRACVEEVAQEYAEFETSELKRRFDQIFEKQNERFERQAEALDSIQNQIRKVADSSDSN